MMHQILNTLAVALSVLPHLPSVAIAAEPAPVPAQGTWTDVTPGGVDVSLLSCENYSSITMVADPARPSDFFTQFHCQLRSTDYGETWSHVGIAMEQAVVFGTPKRVYVMYAWACGGCLLDPALQSAPQPGGSGWARMSTPLGMAIEPAQAATVFDGANYITLTANWRGGLWRFVE